jgi:tetratricopeptide (TPR) repeat protein
VFRFGRVGWLLYGRLLESLGYLAEGLAAKQRVLERDRTSASVHLQIALSYWNQRRYDDMIAWANRSLELDPQHLLAREYLDDLRRTYERRGRAGIVLDEAIARRDPALVHLAVAPQWDWLRVDDRFGERIEAMGLTAAADRARARL